MEIERDLFKRDYYIKIEREELIRAFTSQDEYNAFIAKLSKLIYEHTQRRVCYEPIHKSRLA